MLVTVSPLTVHPSGSRLLSPRRGLRPLRPLRPLRRRGPRVRPQVRPLRQRRQRARPLRRWLLWQGESILLKILIFLTQLVAA